jgi:cyclohexyl-isocyanide hydratase
MSTYRIGLPIVSKVDLLDVSNACEVFRWIQLFWPGHTVEAPLIGKTLDPVVTGNGAKLTPDTTFDAITKAGTQLDLIFVPGGGTDYVDDALANTDLLDFVSAQAKHAKWVTSVCTGAFILAKIGALDGKECTTHWQFTAKLQQQFPKVRVVNGWPRIQTDGNVVTGGGLSSAIDESLYLVGQIAGESVGKQVQLMIQYNPQPPWNVGDPSIADYATYAAVMKASTGSV